MTISGRWTMGGGAIGWERDVEDKDAVAPRNKNPSYGFEEEFALKEASRLGGSKEIEAC